MTVHLVKRDRKRSKELSDHIHAVHLHHQALRQLTEAAVVAAQRAQAAAEGHGPKT
jgi:hypothetical protein